jgi:acyl carrier protein
MRDLEAELKLLIIESLDLEDIAPDDIDSAAPLFSEGLGLDSIDALELGLHIQKKYNIKLDGNSDDTKKHFASVNALKAMIESRLQE